MTPAGARCGFPVDGRTASAIDPIGSDPSSAVGTGVIHETTDDRCPAGFVVVDVGLVADDHFVATLTVCQQARQVAHRPARHEDGGLFADALRGSTLELVDGGVVAEDVVAYLGGGHRGAHGR